MRLKSPKVEMLSGYQGPGAGTEKKARTKKLPDIHSFTSIYKTVPLPQDN